MRGRGWMNIAVGVVHVEHGGGDVDGGVDPPLLPASGLEVLGLVPRVEDCG
jgi:hypothetical protein